MQNSVLLSIRPEFVEKIFNGNKRFEFRRSIFKKRNVQKIVIYASAPISRVVGEFEIEEIINDEIGKLWSKTSKYSGISEDYYLKYFSNKDSGYAIKIRDKKRYKKPIDIREHGLRAPQSFMYINKRMMLGEV